MNEPLPIETWAHLCIRVSDAERSLKFYRDVLGFKVKNDVPMAGQSFEDALGGIKGATGRTIYGEAGGQHLELIHIDGLPLEARGKSKPGAVRAYPHYGAYTFTFKVADIDEAHRRALAMGIPVESPPIEIAGCKVFFINDPDGVRIEILEMPADYFEHPA